MDWRDDRQECRRLDNPDSQGEEVAREIEGVRAVARYYCRPGRGKAMGKVKTRAWCAARVRLCAGRRPRADQSQQSPHVLARRDEPSCVVSHQLRRRGAGGGHRAGQRCARQVCGRASADKSNA